MSVHDWIVSHGRQYSLSALLAALGGNEAGALFWSLAGEELKRLLAVLDPEDAHARQCAEEGFLNA